MTTYIKNQSDRSFKYSATSHRPPIPGKEDVHIKPLEIPIIVTALHTDVKQDINSSANRSKVEKFDDGSCILDSSKGNATNNLLMENSGATGDNTEDSSNSSSGGFSHLKWMQNISFLLQDSEGVKLFKDFLDRENTTAYLEFWFACKGLKMVTSFDQKRIMSLAKSIYNKYIKGPECPLKLKSITKQNIMEKFQIRNIEQTTFDDAQNEVEIMMKTKLYPAFLLSDLFLKFVETELEASKQSSGCDSLDRLARCHVNQRLPTLVEEEEFIWPDSTITKSDIYSNSSSFQRFLPSQYDYSFSNCTHNSYIPVTAVDSELQSLSSDP